MRSAPRWSIRLLVAFGALGFCCVTLAQRLPPTSLEKKTVLLRFSHTHERVARCVADAQSATCSEKRVKAAAATQLTLTPQPSKLVSEPTETRTPVTIVLPARGDGSDSSGEARLNGGHWQLRWADQTAELRLAEGGSAAIHLATTSGRCVLTASGCERDGDFMRRVVTVPAELRSPE
jgi:hypothetical protein